MYVVIDADAFSSIVNMYAKDHAEYLPLFEYIVYGNGKIAYGGTTYENELNNHIVFKSFLLELGRARKTIEIEKIYVDTVEDFLKLNFSGNDHHIVAIVIVHGCEIVCSMDHGLHSLIDKCYCTAGRRLISKNCRNPGHLSRPRIYQNSTHAVLLK